MQARPNKRLYFAYGSNLRDAQMRERCPQSRKIGRAVLADYRWIITTRGYASVVASPGDTVEGVLFEIPPGDEKTLDGGSGEGSYFKTKLPVTCEGREVIALVYIDPVTEGGKPKEEYVGRINAGLADAGLARDYVERAVRTFVPDSCSASEPAASREAVSRDGSRE